MKAFRLSVKIASVAACLFACLAQAQTEYEPTIKVPVTFYDFRSDRTNPEFEQPHHNGSASGGIPPLKLGMVDSLLDADGKPKMGANPYLNHGIRFWFRDYGKLSDGTYIMQDSTVTVGGIAHSYLEKFRPVYMYAGTGTSTVIPTSGSIYPPAYRQAAALSSITEWNAIPVTGANTPYAYANWSFTVNSTQISAGAAGFTMNGYYYPIDTAYKNIVIQDSLTFNHQGNGVYSFIRESMSGGGGGTPFFPLDGRGLTPADNWIAEQQSSSPNHNFSYTMELAMAFKMEPGLTFQFSGDDDVWVFVNGKLAMDLGGIHEQVAGGFALDDLAASHNLLDGKNYEMRMFYCERHSTSANIRVTTNMFLFQRTLRYAAGTGGSVIGSALQLVERGADGEAVYALADAGYTFAGWSDGVTTQQRKDTNVQSNINVTALFVSSNTGVRTLNYSAGAGGAISGNATQLVISGTNGSAVTAVPDSGYVFVKWSDGVTTASRTETAVTANVAVTAQFARRYTLKYTAGTGGSLTVGSITGYTTYTQTVVHGSDGVTVTAVPGSAYQFDRWSDGVVAASRPAANVTADIAVTAMFSAKNPSTLRYIAGAGGSIEGAAVQSVVYGGSGTAVKAVPDAGYVFAGWSDGSTVAQRTDINIVKDTSFTALFKKVCTLSYSAGPGGGVIGESPQSVLSGSNGSPVVAIPAAGYVFLQWSDGLKENIRADNSVTADIIVTAMFALEGGPPPESYKLTYTAGAGGTISGAASQTVIAGADGSEVMAVPDAGNAFVKWSDGVTDNPRRDRNVSAPITVSAVFGEAVYTLRYIVAAGQGNIIGSAEQSVRPGESGASVYVLDNTAAGYRFIEWSDGSKANPRQDKNVQGDITVTAVFQNDGVAVLTPNFNEKLVTPKEDAMVIAPAVILSGEFTAGPNPVDKNVGTINFFRQGRRIANCELRIYDAAGNVINKVKIADNKTLNSQARRKVGAWDLKDKKGRPVSEGTYLVKGVLKTSDGKSEKVSVILGVR